MFWKRGIDAAGLTFSQLLENKTFQAQMRKKGDGAYIRFTKAAGLYLKKGIFRPKHGADLRGAKFVDAADVIVAALEREMSPKKTSEGESPARALVEAYTRRNDGGNRLTVRDIRDIRNELAFRKVKEAVLAAIERGKENSLGLSTPGAFKALADQVMETFDIKDGLSESNLKEVKEQLNKAGVSSDSIDTEFKAIDLEQHSDKVWEEGCDLIEKSGLGDIADLRRKIEVAGTRLNKLNAQIKRLPACGAHDGLGAAIGKHEQILHNLETLPYPNGHKANSTTRETLLGDLTDNYQKIYFFKEKTESSGDDKDKILAALLERHQLETLGLALSLLPPRRRNNEEYTTGLIPSAVFSNDHRYYLPALKDGEAPLKDDILVPETLFRIPAKSGTDTLESLARHYNETLGVLREEVSKYICPADAKSLQSLTDRLHAAAALNDRMIETVKRAASIRGRSVQDTLVKQMLMLETHRMALQRLQFDVQAERGAALSDKVGRTKRLSVPASPGSDKSDIDSEATDDALDDGVNEDSYNNGRIVPSAAGAMNGLMADAGDGDTESFLSTVFDQNGTMIIHSVHTGPSPLLGGNSQGISSAHPNDGCSDDRDGLNGARCLNGQYTFDNDRSDDNDGIISFKIDNSPKAPFIDDEWSSVPSLPQNSLIGKPPPFSLNSESPSLRSADQIGAIEADGQNDMRVNDQSRADKKSRRRNRNRNVFAHTTVSLKVIPDTGGTTEKA